jgi:muconolactone D-isomerase
MLFHVHMVVSPPQGIDKDAFEKLRAAEKARAQELMKQGKWRHLWRIAGKYENYSVFDVKDASELHDVLTSLPFFPFMKMDVTAVCRHPSSIRDDDT